MGRASRQKRERRGIVDPGALARVIAPYTRTSLLALLDAAAASPGSLHRLPSIEYALSQVYKRRADGHTAVKAAELQAILDAAILSVPQLGILEDYVPLDPRLVVAVRWGNDLLRLHPGSEERPIADVVRAHLIAASIDPILIAHRGFGLSDLLELSLRFGDATISRLSPTWRGGEMQYGDAQVEVSEAETEAVGTVEDISSMPSRCSQPDRAEAALRWVTRTPRTITYSPGDATSSFGPVLAIRFGPDTLHPLPVSVHLSSCGAATEALAIDAVRLDPRCEDDFRIRSEKRVAERLIRMDTSPIPRPTIADAGSVHSIVQVSERHALVIGVASSLTMNDLRRRIDEVGDCLDHVKPGAGFSVRGTEDIIPPDAELTKLLIVSGPGHLVLHGPPGTAMMTLDDLDWISQTAKGPDDLYWFCRDVAATGDAATMFTLETMNAWEWWRGNGGAFHHAGIPPGLIVGVHFTEAEWTTAASNALVEDSLASLNIKPLQEWESSETKDDWTRLVERRDGIAWSIIQRPWLVGACYEVGTPPGEDALRIAKVGDALLWTVKRTADAFQSFAAATLGASPLRLLFRRARPHEDIAPLRCSHAASNTVTIEWDERLWKAEEGRAGIIQALLGEALISGLTTLNPSVPAQTRDAYGAAWENAPPAFSTEAVSIAQQLPHLPLPESAPAAARAEARRELASALHKQHIPLGTRTGEDAVRLESRIIYPRLLEMLHETWAECSLDNLLGVATRELECATAERRRQRWEIESNAPYAR